MSIRNRNKKFNLIYPQLTTECKNIILIDNQVSNAKLIANAVNSDTFPIIYSNNSTKIELLALIKEKFTSIERLAICFTFENNKFFLDNESLFNKDPPIINNNVNFILELI